MFDVGACSTKVGMLGEHACDTSSRRGHYGRTKEMGEARFNEIPSLISKVRGHYWGAGSGNSHYLVGHEVADSTNLFIVGHRGYEPTPIVSEEGEISWSAVKVVLEWLFCEAFFNVLPPRQHPTLVAVPSYWNPQQRHTLHAVLFDELNVPA